jgi:hypothetical protein
MTIRHPYTYATLRYVHDPMAGEFVNVGVVLYSPSTRYLGARLRRTYSRLSAVFPDLDAEGFKSAMSSIESELKRLAKDCKERALMPIEGDAASIARTVLPADDSSLQWSPVGSGLAPDPEQQLARLYERLVTRHDRRAEHRRTDEDVWRPFRERLEAAAVTPPFRETTIHGEADQINFKHAWMNGVWHCYEALSFDLANADGIKEKARRWTGHLAAVSDASDLFKTYFIVGAPHEQRLMAAFETALAILKKSPVPTEVFTEEEADKLVARIAEEFRVHG